MKVAAFKSDLEFAPGVTRTRGPRIRNPVLYPPELRGHSGFSTTYDALPSLTRCPCSTCVANFYQLAPLCAAIQATVCYSVDNDAQRANRHESNAKPKKRLC